MKTDKVKIIAIDGSPDNTESLKTYIDGLLPGFQLSVAPDTKSGLQKIQNEFPDVILLDLDLPTHHAGDALKALKGDDMLKNIPVIAITADREEKIKALALGADGFISKPVDDLELTAQIKTALRITEADKWKQNEEMRLAAMVSSRTAELERELKDLKLAEEKLQHLNDDLKSAKEKAEESDRLKSAFLANMSHEIRTPMNAIIGFSGFLTSNNLDHEKRKAFGQIIQGSCDQLLAIINDIIDISKIEANQVTLSPSPFDLNEMLNELYLTLKAETDGGQVSFQYRNKGTGKQCMIYADPNKLKQVITNLLNNAIKFTSSGSIEFGYHVLENNVEIYVKDTGIGISSDQQKMIFDRFWQADSSPTRKFGGNGLGLAIANALVKKMGGSIHVESKPESGSTFTIRLPHDANQMEIPKDLEKKPDLKGLKIRRILLAEDEINNVYFIKELFSKPSISIDHAWNGRDAIDLVAGKNKYDVVLMDLKMPVLDGYEALQQLKKICPELPVIAISAYAMSEDRIRALSAGFDGYVSKPVNINALVRAIQLVIE